MMYPIYYKIASGDAVMKIENFDEFHIVRILRVDGKMLDVAYEFLKGEAANTIIESIKDNDIWQPCDFNSFNSKMYALEQKIKNISFYHLKNK